MTKYDESRKCIISLILHADCAFLGWWMVFCVEVDAVLWQKRLSECCWDVGCSEWVMDAEEWWVYEKKLNCHAREDQRSPRYGVKPKEKHHLSIRFERGENGLACCMCYVNNFNYW